MFSVISTSKILSPILQNHPVSNTVVQKHPVLVEQGVAKNGDDPPDRRVAFVPLGIVLQSLLPPTATGVP